MADQIKMRVFSSRTLASQRERQRQSELRKREAEQKRGRRGQRGKWRRVQLRHTGSLNRLTLKAENTMGVTLQRKCEQIGTNFIFNTFSTGTGREETAPGKEGRQAGA